MHKIHDEQKRYEEACNFNNPNRITQLIEELNNCREDERHTQSQILHTISLVSTVLGLLFGASSSHYI